MPTILIAIIKYLLMAIVIAFMMLHLVLLFSKDGRAVLDKHYGPGKDDLSESQKRLFNIHHVLKVSSIVCLATLWLLRYVFHLL